MGTYVRDRGRHRVGNDIIRLWQLLRPHAQGVPPRDDKHEPSEREATHRRGLSAALRDAHMHARTAAAAIPQLGERTGQPILLLSVSGRGAALQQRVRTQHPSLRRGIPKDGRKSAQAIPRPGGEKRQTRAVRDEFQPAGELPRLVSGDAQRPIRDAGPRIQSLRLPSRPRRIPLCHGALHPAPPRHNDRPGRHLPARRERNGMRRPRLRHSHDHSGDARQPHGTCIHQARKRNGKPVCRQGDKADAG